MIFDQLSKEWNFVKYRFQLHFIRDEKVSLFALFDFENRQNATRVHYYFFKAISFRFMPFVLSQFFFKLKTKSEL